MSVIKKILRRGLRVILKYLTRAVLRKHRPKIIALVGGSQTAIAREAIYMALHEHFPTRRSLEAPEAEFVVPLTIFGAEYYPRNLGQWLKILIKTIVQLVFFKPYSNILILEMTTGLTEILDYWLEITQPQIVITCGAHPESRYLNEETVLKLGEAMDDFLQPYRTVAVQVARQFNIPEAESKSALNKLELPPARIKVLLGQKGNLVVDATYKYFPPSKQSLDEILGGLGGNQIWVKNPQDWQPEKITPQDIVVVFGPRRELLPILNEATINPWEQAL